MSVSPEEVVHIARLAKLELSGDEVTEMSQTLSSILGHMEALGRVDVREVEALAAVVEGAAPLRQDSPGADPLQRAVPEIAPEWRESFFIVPRLAALDADALAAEGGSA